MQIIKLVRFDEELDELISKLKSISSSPYKYRKAKYSDDENVRELIFKKYTIRLSYSVFSTKTNGA